MMDSDKIVKSEAFRAINLLIDQKANDLIFWVSCLQDSVNKAFAEKGVLETRTSYEGRSEGRKEIPAQIYRLRDLGSVLSRIDTIEDEIGELQRFKLRLLGDCDFTDDDEDQKAVFAHDLPDEPQPAR